MHLLNKLINTSWNQYKPKPWINLGLQKSVSEKNKLITNKTWKGIKSLISLKTVASSVPHVLSLDNGNTIINPYDIAWMRI